MTMHFSALDNVLNLSLEANVRNTYVSRQLLNAWFSLVNYRKPFELSKEGLRKIIDIDESCLEYVVRTINGEPIGDIASDIPVMVYPDSRYNVH